MNKERVKLFVDALLSDSYKQCRHWLEEHYSNQDIRNCATGVACRVAMEHGLHIETEQMEFTENHFNRLVTKFGCSSSFMPYEVEMWYEVQSTRFFPIIRDLNDSGKSFAQIADWIERTYLEPVQSNSDISDEAQVS